jgi:hypothetical protein
MAGLLDIFGTGGADTMGLLGMSAEDIKKSRDDAQAQALYALAGRLFQGGKTAPSILQGLQQGQQAYKGAMQSGLQEQLQNAQLQEMLKKRQQEQQSQAEQKRIQQIVQGAYSPEVIGRPAQMVEEDGRYMGETPAVMARAAGAGLTPQVINQLMTSEQGQAKLSQLAKLVPEMRKAGLGVEQKAEDNPFAVYLADPALPANIKPIVEQYSKTWRNLEPAVLDARVAQVGQLIQKQADFQQVQTQVKAQQDTLNSLKEQGLAQSASAQAISQQIALGNQALQRMTAEFNLGQKKEKAQEKSDVKTQAKQQLSDVVGQLKTSYDTLLEGGGITSTGAGGRENLGAKMGTSQVGQFMGSALGTKNQEQRQIIEQTRPLLLNLIKEATGMSASQMNSNAEMQMYLKAATDPKLSYEANVTALKNLDKTFGLGILQDITPPKKKQQTTSSSWGN